MIVSLIISDNDSIVIVYENSPHFFKCIMMYVEVTMSGIFFPQNIKAKHEKRKRRGGEENKRRF